MTGDDVAVSTTGCDRSRKDLAIWKSSRKKRIDVAPTTHDRHFRHIAATSNSTCGVAAFLASEKSGIISRANLRRLSLEPPALLTSTYSTPTAASLLSLSTTSSHVPNKAFCSVDASESEYERMWEPPARAGGLAASTVRCLIAL